MRFVCIKARLLKKPIILRKANNNAMINDNYEYYVFLNSILIS